MSHSDGDLGFSYTQTKAGDVRISHYGREVTVLRGKQARQFLQRAENLNPSGEQQLMARATGHFKHGNERKSSHQDRWSDA
jgi:hypothetical protein